MDIKAKLGKNNIKELIATPRGKGMAAGMLLVVLLLLVLVVATFALPKPGNEVATVVGGPVVPAPAPASQPATPAQTTQTATEDTDTVITDYDLLEYKDPFRPFSTTSVDTTANTGAPSIPNTDESGGNGQTGSDTGGSGGGSDAQNIPSLVDIIDQGAEKFAIVNYQGQEYTVKEGDQIADSPYQVDVIGESSISVLYGDDRLTLQLGVDITK